MSLVNHLKDVDGQGLFMAVAYGLHMVSGQLTKSLRTGSDPTHVVTVQQMLGRGPWDGCEGLWFRGLEIPPADYEFYPGIQSTGMSDPDQPQDSVFDTDTPHSGFAWLRAELPEGVPDFDTKGSPPVGLAGKFRTMKCFDYNNDGTTKGSAGYTTNPALQVADLICRLGGRPSSRIDWAAWEDWRDFNAEEIDYDYTVIPDFEGIGLWVSLYSGADFDTFVKNRVDPYVEFVSSAGSPDVELPVDNFSVRYEGKIKPKYTQTYTFYITHTHGARVYVDNLSTPLIDQWGTTGTHSATIALTADQLYNIRVDWRHTTGNAELRLEWESSSQAREVVPHRALYPKTVQRPRYETHPFFPGPTRLDDAVRTVLNLCNSTYQEVNGKLRFFCLEQLTATSFRFTNSVILDGSLQLIPRDPLNLRNSWQARFRDVDSQYLEEPIDPVIIERQDLIETAGRRIDGQLLELYNTTPHQAWRTLDALVKRSCDRVFDAKLTGLADTYKVLPGDAVSLDIEFLDENARPMLVVEAADNSSEQTADEREFLLHDWTGQTLTEPDEEAPTAPVLDPVTIDSDTEITLDWSASTDNIAVTGYQTRIDGGSWVDRGNVLTYQYTGLTPATEYDFEVRAYDAAGNFSNVSNLESGTTDAPAFNPAAIADTEFYFEADFQALANDDPFTQLTDQSSNAAHATQATSGKRATNKTGILNGLPVARADGGDTYQFPAMPAMTEFTISMIWLRNGGASPVMLKGAGANDYLIGGSGFVNFRIEPGTDGAMASSYESAFELHTWTYDGTTLKGYIDGSLVFSAARSITSYEPQWLLSYADSFNYLTGDLALFQIVSRDMTGADLTAFTTYAMTKYGL